MQFSLNQTRIAADGKLYFDEPMKFQNLTKDFVIHVQLHRRIPKEVKYFNQGTPEMLYYVISSY